MIVMTLTLQGHILQFVSHFRAWTEEQEMTLLFDI